MLACLWTVVSLAGGRLAGVLFSEVWTDIARYSISIALLLAGFWMLARLGINDLRPLSSIGLVKRPGIEAEFGKGVALGWAVGLATVLPSLLSGRSLLRFDAAPGAWTRLLTGTISLLLFAMLVQLLLAGLPMRLLVRVAGPGWALSAVAVLSLLMTAFNGEDSLTGCFFVVLVVCLFTVAFLRTRALWLPLGLQIGWTVSQCLLFGSPLPHTPLVSGVLFLSGPVGAPWLTGGVNGPDLPIYALFVLLLALVVLVRLTRNYAWLYTYHSPVPGGYPVEIPPPAQHEAQVAAKPQASLIQIAPAKAPAQLQQPPDA